MKIKLLLGSIMLGLALTSTAQITISRNDLGDFIGAIFIQANDSTSLSTLSPGNAGANQTWDLTGISNNYQDTLQFLSPAGMLCSDDFPNATLALVRSGMIVYLYDDNSVIESLGFCGVMIPPDTLSVPLTPPEISIIFPFTYNTSFSGQSKMKIQFPNNPSPPDSIRIVKTTNYTSLTDGWGNLITPLETYPALRQKFTRYQIDSTYGYFIGSGWQPVGSINYDTTIEYSWLSQNNPFIATITTDLSGNIQNASYLISATLGINDKKDISFASSVFPNPSTGKFTIALRNSNVNTIEIYNVTGVKVFSASGINHRIYDEIDLTNYPNGIYFINIYTGEKSYKEKVVIH